MDVYRVFHALEQLEGALAEAYERFSQRFTDDPPLSQAFARLSTEEHSHRNLVQYQLRMVMQNPKVFGEVEVDEARLDTAVRTAANLKRLGSTLGARDAVRAALILEGDASEMYYRTVIGESHASPAKLIQAMASDCAAHAGRLKSLAANRNWLPPEEPTDPKS